MSGNTMRLWTIQTVEAYQRLMQTGVFRADTKHICDDSFADAYNWMVSEMAKRIGSPPDGVKYPVWAWYQWEGKRKKPDLRCGGYAPHGTTLVLLTVDIDESDVVLSDFDDWHFVLNYFYLAFNEEDDNRFHEMYEREGFTLHDLQNSDLVNPCLEECRKRIEQSWQRIFDLRRSGTDWDVPLDKKSIQATFWELKAEQILKAKHFIAK